MGNDQHGARRAPATDRYEDLRQTLRDVGSMASTLVDYAIGDPEKNIRQRAAVQRTMADVELMAFGYHHTLADAADQCWLDLAGSGYWEDGADALAMCLDMLQQVADPANYLHLSSPLPGEERRTAEDFYSAVLYCAVSFLLMRLDGASFDDLINLCSPERFVPSPYPEGALEKADPILDEHRKDAVTVNLVDELPDDLDGYGADESGENPCDEQYYASHDRPEAWPWHTVFDSAKYTSHLATLRAYYDAHADPRWPMRVRRTPKEDLEFIAVMPAAARRMADDYLADRGISVFGNGLLVPFTIELERLRRFLWRGLRDADNGFDVDISRTMRVLENFRRRTWAKMRPTADSAESAGSAASRTETEDGR